MKKLLTGFDVERWRKVLLSQQNFTQLKKTYAIDFPEISNGNTPEFWDEKFLDVMTTLFPMAYARNELVCNSLKRQTKILNVGAGKGYLESFIFQKFGTQLEWVGTDFTHITSKQLRRKFPCYSFIKTGLTKLPFEDAKFDTVCLLEVLEHIAPHQTFSVLKELYRVLKKNGTLIISVPLNEGLEQMMPYNPNAHMRDYSIELLQFELESVRFKVKRIETLSAFATWYNLKHFINTFLHLREPNNVIMWAQK